MVRSGREPAISILSRTGYPVYSGILDPGYDVPVRQPMMLPTDRGRFGGGRSYHPHLAFLIAGSYGPIRRVRFESARRGAGGCRPVRVGQGMVGKEHITLL